MFNATTKNANERNETNSNIKSAASYAGYEARNAIEDTADDIRTTANKAGRKVRNLFNNASDEITDAADTVTTYVRKSPVQSSMLALGIGFILGSLFRR